MKNMLLICHCTLSTFVVLPNFIDMLIALNPKPRCLFDLFFMAFILIFLGCVMKIGLMKV